MSYLAGEFLLQNDDKVQRAKEAYIKDFPSTDGRPVDISDEMLTAYYDKLGGLIVHKGKKLELGSFWDVVRKAPKETPELKYVDGIVFIEEGEKLEMEEVVPPKVIRVGKTKSKEESKKPGRKPKKTGRKPKKTDLQPGEVEEIVEVIDEKVE